MSDLILAIVHHLIVFGIAAVLAAELALLRPAAMSPHTVKLLGRFDTVYGALALAILVAGFGRVFHGPKGAAFYVDNPVFWVKVGAFAVVGILSIKPTVRILAWQKSLKADAAFTPPADDLGAVRRRKLAEIHVFALIPIAAAMMARGIGY
ncbi:DUF2214 family protein [Pseudoduganella albidiflava]|uniref:DUF2214 family protein n=1 Tax=Pseudoduganella albidiflava TaxID=321983 RepID=A0A411WS59_9BURK|nr:DUF2214 family protein [Pseudoduganella albidiflava]QBH99615.1 DUF2214 family protein [Pseudoduganella albidiflava]GGY46200.1 membrane protein [Pseudoduganella albidiflava]